MHNKASSLVANGHTEVKYCLGQEKFGTPMLELKVLRKQMYCIEESTCHIVGTVQPPAVLWCPGNSAPLTSLVMPLIASCVIWVCSYEKIFFDVIKII